MGLLLRFLLSASLFILPLLFTLFGLLISFNKNAIKFLKNELDIYYVGQKGM